MVSAISPPRMLATTQVRNQEGFAWIREEKRIWAEPFCLRLSKSVRLLKRTAVNGTGLQRERPADQRS